MVGGESVVVQKEQEHMNPQPSQQISDAVSNGGETMKKIYDTHFLST